MESTAVNTPGVGGYVVAWMTSVVVLALVLLVSLEPGPVPPQTVLWLLFFLVPLSAPFACAGILLVHHVCRDEPRQSLHVLVAAAAGAMTGGLVTMVGVELVVLVPVVAAATALGRAVVIPLVWRRRREAARVPA